ncbi:deleted in malignant brain tumors 1 protein isoform X2 [Nematostella vectensis]|uniref:deleted in malignant brain tumors 1 protein isoform X2 n=1 Tax=Nematostella vectensis TaxID=45351 RepID=UPI002076FAB9|nr:deleted in malignant brain tumors 1 protein isoform X2 [Nematostella vectensis]
MASRFLRYAIFGVLLLLLSIFHVQATVTNVRLTVGYNSSSTHYGTVEVLHNGSWGGICDDSWDINDAHVICRQLGYLWALSAPCCSIFGLGPNPIVLDDVNCHGNENDISECDHRPWGQHDCNMWQFAGVICRPENYTTAFQKVRLTGGAVPQAGRVEIYNAGIWGDINQFGWDMIDGHVLCKGLGYPGVLAVTYRSKHLFHVHLMFTWAKTVNCHGNETSLLECDIAIETRRVSYGYDAGVVCKTENDTALQFRLRNSTVMHAGRVEVLIAGIWGGVSFQHWTINSAHVFCRHVGYTGADMVVSGASILFKLSHTIKWAHEIRCHGNELSLNQCNITVLSNPNIENDAGVICATNASDTRVRLTGSSYPFAGLVSVKLAGVWGTVDNRDWSQTDADVLCRSLGYPGVLYPILFATKVFGHGSGPVWITDLRCQGNETGMLSCQRSMSFSGVWSHDQDAGVVCRENGTQLSQVQVRLEGASVSYAGRVGVSLMGDWGTISAVNFTKPAADVICRQLGFPGSLEALGYGAFGPGLGPTWLEGVGCYGNERNLSQCTLGVLSPVYPTHMNDAGVICDKGEKFEKDFQVRIVGGSHVGRVEVCLKGVWGSVVHVLKTSLVQFGHVVCRQLGYPGVVRPIRNAATKYGRGSGPVWMTHVSCYGNESWVGDCAYDRSFHARYPEVGVECNQTGMTGTTTISPTNSTVRNVTTTPYITILSTASAKSSTSPQGKSPLTEFIVIGLPVMGGVLMCLVALFCIVRYCRGERQAYDTNSELMRMNNVSGRPGDSPTDHSFAFTNTALENGNVLSFKSLSDEKDWCEIPRRKVSLGNKLTSGTIRMSFSGRLMTDGGPVDCLVKMLRDSSNKDDEADLTNELKTMCCLGSHPNILCLLGACSLKGPLYLVMEFPEHGSLLKYLQEHQLSYDIHDNDSDSATCSLPRAEKLRIARDVACGMAYLAEKKCVHRDLAARNIFLGNSGTAKISNIGISQDIYERQFYEKVSKGKLSARWMSPESLESMIFTTMSDVWSYGILLWEIETGVPTSFPNATVTTQTRGPRSRTSAFGLKN